MINRARLAAIIAMGGLIAARPTAESALRDMQRVPDQEPPGAPIRDHRRKTSGSRDYGTKAERIRQGKR